jgi:hypothetical protein
MSGNGTTIPVLNGGFVTLDTQINGQNQSQLYFRRFEGAKATSDGSFYSLEPAQTIDPSIRINKFDNVGNLVATGYLYDTVINQPSGGGGGGGTGFQGPTGPAGINGTNGTNGTPGPTGPAGSNGDQGPTGPAGTNGTNGSQGPTGPAGTNGTNGSQGPTGPAGTNGTNGSQGPTGSTGAPGSTSRLGQVQFSITSTPNPGPGAFTRIRLTFIGLSASMITSGPPNPNGVFVIDFNSLLYLFTGSGNISLSYTNGGTDVNNIATTLCIAPPSGFGTVSAGPVLFDIPIMRSLGFTNPNGIDLLVYNNTSAQIYLQSYPYALNDTTGFTYLYYYPNGVE